MNESETVSETVQSLSVGHYDDFPVVVSNTPKDTYDTPDDTCFIPQYADHVGFTNVTQSASLPDVFTANTLSETDSSRLKSHDMTLDQSKSEDCSNFNSNYSQPKASDKIESGVNVPSFTEERYMSETTPGMETSTAGRVINTTVISPNLSNIPRNHVSQTCSLSTHTHTEHSQSQYNHTVHIMDLNSKLKESETARVTSEISESGDYNESIEHTARNRYGYHANWMATPTERYICTNEFQEPNNYLKGCKWSPDGTCLLTNSCDQYLRLFDLPAEFYSEMNSQPINPDDPSELSPVLKVYEPATIYDYCWLPCMTSSDPSTCFFVSTSRRSPVHMWNAYTSDLTATYKAYNHLDELVSVHSLCFSTDSTKLYCGLNKSIRIYHTALPGRQCTEFKTYCKEGQSGIISCLSVNPVQRGVFAAGSYSRETALYSDTTGGMICMFQGQQGGVTHLMFSGDGNRLYTGGRMDAEILCWDLRQPGHILFSVQRNVQTNQRIYFDLDPMSQWMMTGNHNGTVTGWNTQDTQTTIQGDSLEPTLPHNLIFTAHSDTVNGLRSYYLSSV